MKKITREDIEDFVALVNDAGNRDELNSIKNRFFGAINALQSELEALEGRKGMDYSELRQRILNRIEQWSNTNIGTIADAVTQEVLPLTVPQGFTPDWSKAPEWAKYFLGRWSVFPHKEYPFGAEEFCIPRPLPPKVTRERTELELVNLCFDLFGSWETVVKAIVKEGSLKNLCTAAGISTTTEEV